jgi:hypothetical protein
VLWSCWPDFSLEGTIYCPGIGCSKFYSTTELVAIFYLGGYSINIEKVQHLAILAVHLGCCNNTMHAQVKVPDNKPSCKC